MPPAEDRIHVQLRLGHLDLRVPVEESIVPEERHMVPRTGQPVLSGGMHPAPAWPDRLLDREQPLVERCVVVQEDRHGTGHRLRVRGAGAGASLARTLLWQSREHPRNGNGGRGLAGGKRQGEREGGDYRQDAAPARAARMQYRDEEREDQHERFQVFLGVGRPPAGEITVGRESGSGSTRAAVRPAAPSPAC